MEFTEDFSHSISTSNASHQFDSEGSGNALVMASLSQALPEHHPRSLGQPEILPSSSPISSFTFSQEIGLPRTTTSSNVPPLLSLCLPLASFQVKLKPINLSEPLPLPLPVTRLVSPQQSLQSDCEQNTFSERKSKMVDRSLAGFNRHRLRNKVLYKIGARSHHSDEKKLLSAVKNGEQSKVLQFLNDGVDPNVSDHKLRTPLHIAAAQGQHFVGGLLLAKRADPNRRDILGNTPLHLAVCRGDRQTVTLLIHNGANIHLKDNAGRTPSSLVHARLNTLRKDRSISTDKLKGEFLLMRDFLHLHSTHDPSGEAGSINDLCDRMEAVSTREQADEIADTMINKLSYLSFESLKVIKM